MDERRTLHYGHDKLRYPSDLTDEEWCLIEPLIPPAKHGGRKREVVVREVVNGVMYVSEHRMQLALHPQGLANEEVSMSTLFDEVASAVFD